MSLLFFLQILLLAGFTCATVIQPTSFAQLNSRAAASAASILLQIAPTSGSCANPPVAGECSTNVEAAPYLISAFQAYGIYDVHEMAALTSDIAFESGDFKYNINHFPAPGRPGAGTRSMLTPPYVLDYVKSIPALASQTSATTTSGLSDDELNTIRALVLPDEYTWGSAAWYLTSQCSSSIRTQLQAGGQAGFEAYLGCLGVSATSDRLAYWNRANTAFGISS